MSEQLPPTGTYVVDRNHSSVGFVARHLIGAKVRGKFREFDGEIEITDPPENSSLRASAQVKTIDTGQEKRDAHLISSDFFDLEKHPAITLESTQLKHIDGAQWRLSAELTLLGVARPIEFEVEYLGTGPGLRPGSTIVAFSATADIDRRDYGVTFSGAIDSGGLIVGNKVTIELEIEAKLQP
jgi:polyisoprenoid-binding protein YceI